MSETTHSLISEAFHQHTPPIPTRIDLSNPKLEISASRIRTPDNAILLNEVWFFIKTGIALTREQIESAISLIPKRAKVVAVGKVTFSATKREEALIPFEEFIERYLSDAQNLRSITDTPPSTSMNDRIIKGPVAVPPHQWASYYAAFEAYNKTYPEFGMVWNSIVLHRDGIAIRVAHVANLPHSILPQTAKMLEGIEFKDDAQAVSAIQQIVELDEDAQSITSVDDLFKRLSQTPEPYIPPADINQVGEYASTVLGEVVTSLDYSVST